MESSRLIHVERNRCAVANHFITSSEVFSCALTAEPWGLAIPMLMSHDLLKLPRRGRVSHGRQGGQYGRVTRADAAGSDSARDGTPDARSISDGSPGHRQVLSPTARHAQ